MNEPHVQVGILSRQQIGFTLHGAYRAGGADITGPQTAAADQGRVRWDGRLYDELLFTPTDGAACSFELQDVTIGIGFHWERHEDQRFRGVLRLFVDDGRLTAVNIVPVEEYLTSVISSEMSATASPELLKAHAVISRSWLLANLQHDGGVQPTRQETEGGTLVWYERDAHTRFDVCADDHCQRYQGITRASTPAVRQAVAATRGEVLAYGGRICDARFSKCCGGALEEFATCWADTPHPYLRRKRDWPSAALPDLTQEAEAERWIRSAPDAFCHTTDAKILRQVLNNYDQETADFYRWRVEYAQDELASLIRRRSGTDYGGIVDLQLVARGTSGRLWQLRIVGTKRTAVIGKELEIRRTLSPTHLYSSAFVVDKAGGCTPDGLPRQFVLTGAGWGHGVGLCQIGAAVMGEQGYGYADILRHYYPGADLEKKYL